MESRPPSLHSPPPLPPTILKRKSSLKRIKLDRDTTNGAVQPSIVGVVPGATAGYPSPPTFFSGPSMLNSIADSGGGSSGGASSGGDLPRPLPVLNRANSFRKSGTKQAAAQQQQQQADLHSPDSFVAKEEREYSKPGLRSVSRGRHSQKGSFDRNAGGPLAALLEPGRIAHNNSPMGSPVMTYISTRPASRANAASPFPRSGSGFGAATGGGAESSKADFLAFMAHELRNPLHNVIGCAELLLTSNLQAEQRELLESLSLSSQLMSRIVDDVLDLGKLKSGMMEIELMPFDLFALLRDIERMNGFDMRIKAAAPTPGGAQSAPRVEWSVRVHENLTLVAGSGFVPLTSANTPGTPRKILIGDSTRLTQILTNLLSNAFKFCQRGFVRLFVRAVTVDDDGITTLLPTPTGDDLTSLPNTAKEKEDSISRVSAQHHQQHHVARSMPQRTRALTMHHPAPSTTTISGNGSGNGSVQGSTDFGVVSPTTALSTNVSSLAADPHHLAFLRDEVQPRPMSRTASRATILEHVRVSSPFLGSMAGPLDDDASNANLVALTPPLPAGSPPTALRRPLTLPSSHSGITPPATAGSNTLSPLVMASSSTPPLVPRAVSRGPSVTQAQHSQSNSQSQAAPSVPPLWVEFMVQDSGLGIAAENLPRLFQDYSQAKVSIAREFGGTGLGLSIVRTLVDLMCGSLQVSSELGVGTTFTFCIPLQPFEANDKNSMPQSQEPRPTQAQAEPSPMHQLSAGNEQRELSRDGAGSQSQPSSPGPSNVSSRSRFDFAAAQPTHPQTQRPIGLKSSRQTSERPPLPNMASDNAEGSSSTGSESPELSAGSKRKPREGSNSLGPSSSNNNNRDSLDRDRSMLTRALLGSARKHDMFLHVTPPISRASSDPEAGASDFAAPGGAKVAAPPAASETGSPPRIPDDVAARTQLSLLAAAAAPFSSSSRADSGGSRPTLQISMPLVASAAPPQQGAHPDSAPPSAPAHAFIVPAPSRSRNSSPARGPVGSSSRCVPASVSASANAPDSSGTGSISNIGATSLSMGHVGLQLDNNSPALAAGATVGGTLSAVNSPATTPADSPSLISSGTVAAAGGSSSNSSGDGGIQWGKEIPGASAVKILFVEDNLANQKLGRHMLSKRGFNCVVASDGVEAVDLVTADGTARRLAGAQPAVGKGEVPVRRAITLTTLKRKESLVHGGTPTAGETLVRVVESPPSAPAVGMDSSVPTLSGVAQRGAGLETPPIPSAFDASYSSFDLILMDCGLPRMSGMQATQLLRSAGFAGRILALTASDSATQRNACLDAGMDGFLSKPFKADELIATVLEQHKLKHSDPPMPVRRLSLKGSMPPLSSPAVAAASAASATPASAAAAAPMPWVTPNDATPAASTPATAASAASPASSPATATAAAAAGGAATSTPPRPRATTKVTITPTGTVKHTIAIRAKTAAERAV